MSKQHNTPYQPSPMTKGAPSDATGNEKVRGQDVKKARGANRDAGHSPNEAGTDQRVEDAKKARH